MVIFSNFPHITLIYIRKFIPQASSTAKQEISPLDFLEIKNRLLIHESTQNGLHKLAVAFIDDLGGGAHRPLGDVEHLGGLGPAGFIKRKIYAA